MVTCLTPIIAIVLAASSVAAQRVGPPSAPPVPSVRPLAALGVIDGVVTDTTLRPVSFAEVVVFRTGISLQTDAHGRFRFVDVPAGQYIVIVRRLGFRPVSAVVQVMARDTLRLAYTLEPGQNLLDSVVVSERSVSLRMLEFEQRRKEGRGFFITQEQIERRNLPIRMEYLRHAPSVTLTPSHNASGLSEYVAISRREGGTFLGDGAGACAMQVVLDGVPMPQRFPLELLPPPRELAGIEVYSGPASVPPQFSGADRRCGMIIVWTRDR
jgi:hypothetical protein